MNFAEDRQDISVVEMSTDDLSFVLRIQNEANLSFWGLKDYEMELDRADSISLIVKEKNERKGFLTSRLIISDDIVEIYNIGIAKKSRRSGYGRILFMDLLKRCAERNIKMIWLEVRISNTAAISFYQSFGFEITGQRKEFYTSPIENASIMELDLTGQKHSGAIEKKNKNLIEDSKNSNIN